MFSEILELYYNECLFVCVQYNIMYVNNVGNMCTCTDR